MEEHMKFNMLNTVKNMLFVGDTVPNFPFRLGESFKRLCSEHDLCVFNMEGSFSDRQEPLIKAGPNILLDREHLRPISDCFNVATLANNHSMDFEAEGLQTTIALLNANGIATVGAGMDLEEAFLPLDIGNCRIISVAENEFGAAQEDRAGIATVDIPLEVYRRIKNGHEAGRFVVVVSHGGTETIPIPPPYLRERYKLWIEYGADLIIGNHPHVVQGHEQHEGKSIFYSLGNFAFFNDSFKKHRNADWSISISVDVENDKIKVIPLVSDENRVINLSNSRRYVEEFERLCSMIRSPDYKTMYAQIASEKYSSWYSRLAAKSVNDSALLLHYLRCDAHRNMVQSALSQSIGESKFEKEVKKNAVTESKKEKPHSEIKPNVQFTFRIEYNTEKSPHDIKIRPGSMDKYIIEEMEKDVYHVSEYLRAGDTVLDVGAYNGTFALFVKKICPDSKIICLEPMPGNFAELQENARNIAHLEQIALVAKPGPIIMYDFGLDASACHSIYRLNTNLGTPIEVEGDSLQNVFRRHRIEHLRFLKLDCQGAEFEVIPNTPHDILARIDYIGLEVHSSISSTVLLGMVPDASAKKERLYKHLLQSHVPFHGDIEKDSIQVWKKRSLIEDDLSSIKSKKKIEDIQNSNNIDLGRNDENWFTHEQAFSDLLGTFAGRPDLLFLELGSWKGRSALWLAENILTGGNSRIICVDVWDVSRWDLKSSETQQLLSNPKRMEELKIETLYETFLNNTKNLRHKIVPMRMRTVDALKEFVKNDTKFDFIFIDADHSENAVYEDFSLSYECIKSSGIIYFDDLSWVSVQNAIERISVDFGIHIETANVNGAYYIHNTANQDYKEIQVN
ncbi:MAG: FkbM family methyltransferase [Deltaproteobacteria bacterium]|nr:FkbM family methyltransferase [Deltaproteobacteria bacterium]